MVKKLIEKMVNMKKKKKSIIGFFIKMAILFMIYFFAQQILVMLINNSIIGGRYGQDAFGEIIWAGLVLILLLLYKNKYIFTEERESFRKGLKYIAPEIIISTVFLTLAIITMFSTGEFVKLSTTVNLIIYCIFIGIVEEFLCRGWVLNEFLERFSSNKKEKIVSIILSSLVFGLIHYFNLFFSGTFLNTTIQVINAGVSGVFLALVYYKTKNIWLVVASHAYWDFSLMLASSTSLVECYSQQAPSSIAVALNSITIIGLTIGYLLMCYWLYRKTDLYEKEDKNKSKNYFAIAGIIIYLIGLFFPAEGFLDESEQLICPVYKYTELKENYSLTQVNYKTYELTYKDVKQTIKEEIDKNDNKTTTEEKDKKTFIVENIKEYNFILKTSDDNKVIFENSKTNQSVELSDEIYQEEFYLIENQDSYIIILAKDSSTILYGKYSKTEITDDNMYLEKVKTGLKEYHVPEISNIFVLSYKEDGYKYPYIITNISETMIMDKDDNLYFIK